MAETAGEEANIHPVKTWIEGESGRTSTISRKAVLSGVSVGGFLWRLLVAGAGHDLQGTEARGLVERRLDGRDPGGGLVQALEDGAQALALLRRGRRADPGQSEAGAE